MSDQSVPYTPDGDMSVDAELEANSPSGALQDEQKEITAVEGTEEIIAAIEEPQGAASGETPTGSVSSPPPVPPAAATAGESLADNDRLMAALAYFLWFIGPAIILLSPDMAARRFQRYHAIQGLGLAVALAVATLVIVVLGMVLCCVWVLLLVPLGATVYCTILAYEGKYFRIPVLTNLMVSEGWLEQV